MHGCTRKTRGKYGKKGNDDHAIVRDVNKTN